MVVDRSSRRRPTVVRCPASRRDRRNDQRNSGAVRIGGGPACARPGSSATRGTATRACGPTCAAGGSGPSSLAALTKADGRPASTGRPTGSATGSSGASGASSSSGGWRRAASSGPPTTWPGERGAVPARRRRRRGTLPRPASCRRRGRHRRVHARCAARGAPPGRPSAPTRVGGTVVSPARPVPSRAPGGRRASGATPATWRPTASEAAHHGAWSSSLRDRP